MSKLTKNQRIYALEIQVKALMDKAKINEPKPQLKQLDQSVFDGLDEKWRFAAVDQNAETNLFEEKPVISNCGNYWVNASGAFKRSVLHFDNSNWQNLLIERDAAKEPTDSNLAATPNDFKDGDLVFELDFANGIKLVNLKKVGRLASEDYDFQTRYGYNYLKDGRAYPIFSIPHLMHATIENRKALVTLYGEKAVPQLPSEAAMGAVL